MDQRFLTASFDAAPLDALPLDVPSHELRQAFRARQQQQVRQRERFEFGRNWRSFLDSLDDRRISEAEQSLRAMLHREDLRGQTFLDVGAGSGLFSLAAARLGARRVLSFDFDPRCVECADLLRERYGRGLGEWTVELGDVLAAEYMRSLGRFDVVYSWGVLHQTGDMWRALEHVAEATAPGGLLYLSIYNDQPWLTPWWTFVKRLYNRGPRVLRPLLAGAYLAA
ncbi:MAG: class I SAM-dependent methyltransferase, partial [Pirellulaceae bacterium]|nr:class I SAM-dependent methyltransferase [Pirellulaceae bacterium]